MSFQHQLDAKSDIRIESTAVQEIMDCQDGLVEERLPFTVKIVRNDNELGKAVSIRRSAYARHLPALAATLASPEELDCEEDSVIVLAESKLDGSPVGTMRIQNNYSGKLALEHAVDLPEWLQGRRMIEISRFGVAEGRMGRLAKTVLVKAGFQYSLLNDIEWIVITARAPLDTLYEKLLFQDVFPNRGFIPMPHVGNIPHRILAFDVRNAYASWSAAKHPLLDFMCKTFHPDLRIATNDASTRNVVARLPNEYLNSGLNPLANTR
ncbi:MAG: hypothetical protein HZC23_12135 [Rhodocyclales bacterium]|nr:hypothetical protein [Rhodocyclales bacterium]